jgi:hypothetical protein
MDLQSVARILNLPAPVAGAEPARLTDLNAAVATLNAALAGFTFIENPAFACATANINVASPGATIDGVAPVSGDPLDGLVLLTAQTTTSQNGLYIWNGAAVPMTRAVYVFNGGTVVVVGPLGTSNKNSLWLQTTDDPVIGTTAITFTQFGTTVSAGTGITLTGSVISLTSPVAVANGGTNSTTAPGALTNLGAAGLYSTTFGDGASSSFTITHGLGRKYVHVAVYNIATGAREDCTVVCNSTTQCTLSAEAWTAAPPSAAAYEVVVIG